MIRILSVPMIATGFVSSFFFFFYLFLSLKTRTMDKQHKSYLIFSIYSFVNTIYVFSFSILINSNNNLDLLNIINRITIIFAMFLILSAIHFNKCFFNFTGKKDLFIFYILNLVFSFICLFDNPLFLAKKFFATSRYYAGLEFGIFFQIWGVYIIIMMFYAVFILIRGCLLYIQNNRTLSSTLLLLLLATIAWNSTGILDALTAIHVIDLPPLTWAGSLVLILGIEIILVMKIENLFFRIRALYEQVIHDSSTNVFSKSYFEMELDRKLLDKKDADDKLNYLILMDIDDFKEINDTYGHVFGDMVLKKIADIMKKNLRQPDIIARYGGDEFIILMTHSGGIELTTQVIERIRVKIHNEILNNDEHFRVTCSFGITLFDQDSISNTITRDKIIAKADVALYKAKNTGKDRIYILNHEENNNTNKT